MTFQWSCESLRACMRGSENSEIQNCRVERQPHSLDHSLGPQPEQRGSAFQVHHHNNNMMIMMWDDLTDSDVQTESNESNGSNGSNGSRIWMIGDWLIVQWSNADRRMVNEKCSSMKNTGSYMKESVWWAKVSTVIEIVFFTFLAQPTNLGFIDSYGSLKAGVAQIRWAETERIPGIKELLKDALALAPIGKSLIDR